jgi:hypothetical protein
MDLRACVVILCGIAIIAASPDAQARRHGHHFGRHPAFGLVPPSRQDQPVDPPVWPRQPESRSGIRGESRDGWGRGRTVELTDLIRMCGELAEQLAVWPITQIEQAVQPTEAQRPALQEVGAVSGEAAHQLRTACVADVPATLTARLEAVEKSLEAMLQATNSVRPRVETFYRLLDDERKARLVIWMNPAAASDGAEQHVAPTRGRSARLCEAPSSIQLVGLPVERLDFVLQPTQTQLAAVRALQSATAKALETLKLNCPTEEALTPPRRVEITWRRLDALLQAVRIVSPAVRELYELLSDEQKKRLDKTS